MQLQQPKSLALIMIRKIMLLLVVLILTKLEAQDLFTVPKSSFKTLSEVWDLDKTDRQGTFKIAPYKPIYVTAGRWSNRPNRLPQSENPNNSLSDSKDFNSFEAKFQLSFKTKVAQSLLFGTADLWVGFTQIAHWQVYNEDLSRAFRELNYEPEIMLNFPLNLNVFGLTLRMAGVTFNHQSNGRDLPRSRSWNRIIFNLALEKENFQIYLSPWLRVNNGEDENPLITSYIGNGRITAIYKLQKHKFYAIATNTFTFKDNRGSLEFNYLYPINSDLNVHAQFFTGYGETLIDYNHYQSTFGIGVSFVNW